MFYGKGSPKRNDNYINMKYGLLLITCKRYKDPIKRQVRICYFVWKNLKVYAWWISGGREQNNNLGRMPPWRLY